MGSALVKGLSQTGRHSVTACDIDEQALEDVSEYCTRTTTDLATTTEADVVFVVVKPDLTAEIVADLDLSAEQTLVSIAAGVSMDVLKNQTDANIVRVMPNLAAENGHMAAAVSGELGDDVRELLNDVGVFVEIDEAQMDIATAVNGSGPAFVFYLLKAMASAGVDSGLPPEDARILAAQTFKGAAETVLRSDREIEELVDAVCSPKGTTIEGMEVLWDSDVEETIGNAVTAAEHRATELADKVDNE